MIKNKKIIASVIVVSIAFTSNIYASWLNNYKNNWDIVIKNVLDNLERNISSPVLKERLKRERNQVISNYTKEEVIKDILNKTSKINLLQDKEILKISWNKKNEILKEFKKAIERTWESEYRLIVKTELNYDELKSLFWFFDIVSITQKQDLWNNAYELIFSSTSKIWKMLKAYLKDWLIPTNLFEKVEIVKPVLIKWYTDGVNYLSWEDSKTNWWIEKIWASEYQYSLSKSQKIKIWVLDTWIDYNHTDLSQNLDLTLAKNFVNNSSSAQDDHWHWTHVAWIIWASVNNSWIYWVNSNVSLVPLKILDANWYTTNYALADAINYAADNNIKVINMSLWWDWNPTNDIICSAITNAKLKWTISIVAAWNENANVNAKVPAWCSDAITVWAVDQNIIKASFSNYWDEVDLSAPWVSIYSTLRSNTYWKMSWTSMATPFVSWLVWAMLANSWTLDQNNIRTILQNTWFNPNSSVNIGKFISMTWSLSYLQVKKDSEYTSTTPTKEPTTDTNTWTTNTWTVIQPPTDTNTWVTNPDTNTWTVIPPIIENKLPLLNITSKEISLNRYLVNFKTSDIDWKVVSYKIYVNWKLYANSNRVYTLNSFLVNISSDSIVKVEVIDNKWWLTSKEIKLTYKNPVNKIPVIKVSNKDYLKLYNYVFIIWQDMDWFLKDFNIYINWQLNYTNSWSFGYIAKWYIFKKWQTYNIKIVWTDNAWDTTTKEITVK